MYKKELGERIKELRGQTSIAAFCRQFNIHRNTLPRYETGKRLPDADLLAALCKEFNVRADWLLLGEGPKYKAEDSSSQASSTPSKGNGQNNIQFLEDPFISEIKLFLKEMTGDDPDWRIWFKVEVLSKISKFNDWYQKRREEEDSDENLAAG